jgi:ABC-2 type transport system permease protein
MRKTLRVARREYLAAVKTKGFIIGLAIAPLFMSGSILAMLILKNRVDTTDQLAAIVDRSGIVAEALIQAAKTRNDEVVFDFETGRKMRPEYHFEVVTPNDEDPVAQRLALSDRVRSGELRAFIEIGRDVLHPQSASADTRIVYYSENSALDDLRRWIDNPINNYLRHKRLMAAGVDSIAVDKILAWYSSEGMGLVSVNKETGQVTDARRAGKLEAVGIPAGMAMLTYMMIMMGAIPLLSSVMEEKSQRIAEVLLGSIKPFEFMMGKVIGGIGVSLTSSSVYVISGVVAVSYLGFADYIPTHVIPWFFLYLILAIIMFGGINAALGAVCNDMKDAQNLTFPAMVPVILPLFVMVPVAKEPLTGFATVLSLIPPFVPTLMTLRMCTPVGIPAWQPWVALAGLLICTIGAIWAGGRIFRIGILMQGKAPTAANLLRWAIRG